MGYGYQDVELEQHPPEANPLSSCNSRHSRMRRVTVHAQTQSCPRRETNPVPGVGNDVLELVTVPRHEERGLDIYLSVLLESCIDKHLGSAEEASLERLVFLMS